MQLAVEHNGREFGVREVPRMISNADLEVLVDAGWIADHLDDADVRLVEIDVSPATYNQGHIPGAVLWNAYSDLRDSSYRPVPGADFERLLSRSGITPDSTIVTYGYGAFLGFWLMKSFGHRQVRVLNGTRDEWIQRGGEWSTVTPTPSPTSYALPAPDGDMLVGRLEVERAMRDEGSVLLDVRTEAEFRGERFWPSGATADTGRAGHIPGAVNVPIDLARDTAGVLKEVELLRSLYANAGASPEKRLILYCTISNRASVAWFILKYLLGYPDAAVYQGSYVEWGKLPDTAVETG